MAYILAKELRAYVASVLPSLERSSVSKSSKKSI
jgi:hypothetical protein